MRHVLCADYLITAPAPDCRRDKGHFIAHAIGGGLDMNIFSQARDLNRGISEQGKVYRLMERYC